MVTRIRNALLLAAGLLVNGAALAVPCVVTDVTIEGQAAEACFGMYSGNVNSLADINAALGASYIGYLAEDLPDDGDGLYFEGDGSFALVDLYGDALAVALKQNTHWAVFVFDLTAVSNGGDGVLNGTWDTSGSQWDGNNNANGCQGCGGLSHGAFVWKDELRVDAPGSLGLLLLGGLGVMLGARRWRR